MVWQKQPYGLSYDSNSLGAHQTVFCFMEVEYKFQLYIFQGHGFKKMSLRNLMSVSTKIYMLNDIYLVYFLNIV